MCPSPGPGPRHPGCRLSIRRPRLPVARAQHQYLEAHGEIFSSPSSLKMSKSKNAIKWQIWGIFGQNLMGNILIWAIFAIRILEFSSKMLILSTYPSLLASERLFTHDPAPIFRGNPPLSYSTAIHTRADWILWHETQAAPINQILLVAATSIWLWQAAFYYNNLISHNKICFFNSDSHSKALLSLNWLHKQSRF